MTLQQPQPGATLTAPQLAMCSIAVPPASDEVVSNAEAAFWGRFYNIMLMALIMLILGFFGYIFGKAIADAVSDYNENAVNKPKTSGMSINTQFDPSNDNEVYVPPASAAQNTSDYAQYKKYMAAVKERYKNYNKNIAAHATEVMGKDPQDIIDERIMLREHDNYD